MVSLFTAGVNKEQHENEGIRITQKHSVAPVWKAAGRKTSKRGCVSEREKMEKKQQALIDKMKMISFFAGKKGVQLLFI